MNTVLQFSGGKDSLACLYLNRERWDSIYVLWVNTGAAYPEVVESMQKWKERLPHFIEVKSDQPSQIAEYGYPSDVVPVNHTRFARTIGLNPPILVQSYIECCAANIWFPMRDATAALGVTNVIRGQRADEKRRAPFKNGYVENGITYWLPIENWTQADVFAYLRQQGAEIPKYYRAERTSRDCWNCTAFLDENAERLENLPAAKVIELHGRLAAIKKAVNRDSYFLEKAHGRTDLILQRD